MHSPYAAGKHFGRKIAPVNTNELIAKHVDALTERQAVLAENIANANTPAYKTKDVDLNRFKDYRHRSVTLKTTRKGHMLGVKPEHKYHVIKTPDEQKLNKNDVNIPKQMAKIASNQDEYNKAIRSYMVSNNLVSSVLGAGGN